jgi:hypothetical protein
VSIPAPGAGAGGATAPNCAGGSCAQPATASAQANKNNSKERLTRIRHPARFIERKPINARYG